jgi:hypothetical protein
MGPIKHKLYAVATALAFVAAYGVIWGDVTSRISGVGVIWGG